MSVANDVPVGFKPYAAISPFMAHLGQLYVRPEEDGSITLGVRVQTAHLNHQEAMHGGMVATLADNAMGYHVAKALGGPVATVHLGIDYLARVGVGDWLEVRSQIDRQGKRMVYAACTGRVNGQMVLRATAVFSAITRS